MPNKNGGNGNGKTKHNPLTDEQLKSLAVLTLQNCDAIERLIDDVIAIKILLIESGAWPHIDEQPLKDARRKRADAAALVKMQMQRYRKSLGLD